VAQIQRVIDTCDAAIINLAGTFRPAPTGQQTIVVSRPIELHGGQETTFEDLTVDVEASYASVSGIRFVRQAQNRSTVVRVGSRARAEFVRIADNEFVDSLNGGNGGIVAISARHNNRGAEIVNNRFTNFSGNGGVVHAIKLGVAFLNDDGIGDPILWNSRGSHFIGFEDGDRTRTIIRDNAFVTTAFNTFDSVIQLNSPAEVTGNCLNGGFNGISTKSSFNFVSNNTITAMAGDGALYMRNGNFNVFDSNDVYNNNKAFDLWSGNGTVFVNNRMIDSWDRPGTVHGASHGGSRPLDWDGYSDPNQALSDADLQPLRWQTAHQFTNKQSLFVNNTIDLDKSIFWHISGANRSSLSPMPWEVPNNMWFVNNRFEGDGEAGGKQVWTQLFQRVAHEKINASAIHLVGNHWQGTARFGFEAMPADDQLSNLGTGISRLRQFWAPFLSPGSTPGLTSRVGAANCG